MNRRLAAFSILAALALGFLLVRAGAAEATNSRMTSFLSAYPSASGTRLDSCAVCHNSSAGGGSFNAYGTAYVAANKSFTAIDGLDSDNDGFTNGAEIAA